MNQSWNDAANVAGGLRTSNMATKGCDVSPESLVRWNAYSTFGSDTAEWCRPSIEYQGCAEMKAIWYSQRGEWGNEIDAVRRMRRWWDAKKEVSRGRKLQGWCFMLKWHPRFNTIRKRLLFLKEEWTWLRTPCLIKQARWEGSLTRGTTGLQETIFLHICCIKRIFADKQSNLLHRFEQSLAVVLEGHDELQLSASRLHCCWSQTHNTGINNTFTVSTNLKYFTVVPMKGAVVMYY